MLPHAQRLALLPEEVLTDIANERDLLAEELARLQATHVDGVSLARMLRRPDFSYADLHEARTDLPPDVVREVEVNTKYEGYIVRQRDQIARARKLEQQRIPTDFDYDQVRGLRHEAGEKLKAIQPDDLGQASRISGVNPADVALLSIWLRRVGERG